MVFSTLLPFHIPIPLTHFKLRQFIQFVNCISKAKRNICFICFIPHFTSLVNIRCLFNNNFLQGLSLKRNPISLTILERTRYIFVYSVTFKLKLIILNKEIRFVCFKFKLPFSVFSPCCVNMFFVYTFTDYHFNFLPNTGLLISFCYWLQ